MATESSNLRLPMHLRAGTNSMRMCAFLKLSGCLSLGNAALDGAVEGRGDKKQSDKSEVLPPGPISWFTVN